MTEKTQLFQFAGERPAEKTEAEKKKKWYQDRPVAAELFLGLLVLGCLFCGQIMTKDPSYMDLKNCSVMPCREFLFGTDTMGRDIFSMIWYGGRISLAIGLLSTLISTVIAVLFGAVSGCAPAWLDALLMRLTEIFLSVPNLLLVIFLLAAAGKSNVITISAVIGMTSWTSITTMKKGNAGPCACTACLKSCRSRAASCPRYALPSKTWGAALMRHKQNRPEL